MPGGHNVVSIGWLTEHSQGHGKMATSSRDQTSMVPNNRLAG